MTAIRGDRPKYLHPPEIVRRSEYQNVDECRVGNWISPWDFQEPLDVGIIGAPLGKAGPFWKGVGEAPNAIRESFARFTTYSPDFDLDMQALRVRDLGDIEMDPTDIVGCQERIWETLKQLYSLHKHFVPVIIGGDHSIARPTVRAFREGRGEVIGVVHFDAHDDLRSFSWGGPTSATPFRGILEDGTVNGRNLVQLGLHGFASSREAVRWGERQGVTWISVRQMHRRGVQEVMEQAVAVAGAGTEGIYVSLDIDVLDPAFAPGTGATVSGGMTSWDLLEAVYFLGSCAKVKGLELVEVDPLKDIKDVSVKMACSVILTFLGGLYSRQSQEGA